MSRKVCKVKVNAAAVLGLRVEALRLAVGICPRGPAKKVLRETRTFYEFLKHAKFP